MSSTAGQPPRLYELGKLQKNDISLRPKLSIPGSSYEKIKTIARYFDKIEDAIIEANKEVAKAIKNTKLYSEEILFFMDVKSL